MNEQDKLKLQAAKKKADDLGIKYNARIGLKKLTAKIENKHKEWVDFEKDSDGAIKEKSVIVEEIKEVATWGIVDGVTTNPSLIAKSVLVTNLANHGF